MPRYVTRASLPFEDKDYGPRIMGSVNVIEHEMRKTGLVDQYGRDIYREPNAIGFQAEIEE